MRRRSVGGKLFRVDGSVEGWVLTLCRKEEAVRDIESGAYLRW